MKTYLALFSVEFQQHLQYRIAAVAGAVTNIAFGFFRIFLLTAFYGASDSPQPMELSDLYTYIWFGQVMFSVMPIVGLFGSDSEEIRTGAIAYRLTRPISLYSFYFSRILGRRVTALCTRSAIQVLALVFLFPLLGLSKYGMKTPDATLLPFLILSLVNAIFLSGAVHAFITMTGFWTISTRGSSSISYAVISLFSGLLIPIVFFPPAARLVAYILPFRGLYDIPARLYTGTFTPTAALAGLGHQILWLIIIVAAGAFLAKRGMARLEVAGG